MGTVLDFYARPRPYTSNLLRSVFSVLRIYAIWVKNLSFAALFLIIGLVVPISNIVSDIRPTTYKSLNPKRHIYSFSMRIQPSQQRHDCSSNVGSLRTCPIANMCAESTVCTRRRRTERQITALYACSVQCSGNELLVHAPNVVCGCCLRTCCERRVLASQQTCLIKIFASLERDRRYDSQVADSRAGYWKH